MFPPWTSDDAPPPPAEPEATLPHVGQGLADNIAAAKEIAKQPVGLEKAAHWLFAQARHEGKRAFESVEEALSALK